jgi:hypothetical protein
MLKRLSAEHLCFIFFKQLDIKLSIEGKCSPFVSRLMILHMFLVHPWQALDKVTEVGGALVKG